MKKVLSTILCLSLIFSMALTAKAESPETSGNENSTTTSSSDLIFLSEIIPRKVKKYVMDNASEMAEEAYGDYVGSPISTYELTDGNLVNNNLYFFPVFQGEEVVSIISVSDLDILSYTHSNSWFVDEINDLLKQHSNYPYVIISDGLGGSYILGKDYIKQVYGFEDTGSHLIH